jgi:excisionase family DNA binding protein
LPAPSAIAVIQGDQFELDPSPETLNERQTAFALGATLEEVRTLGDRKILDTVRFGPEKHYWTESVRNLARARAGHWRWRAETQDPKSAETSCRLAALLTVTEARRELGNVSRTTLYALIAKGRLKTVKVGTRRMVVSESLEAWIKKAAK